MRATLIGVCAITFMAANPIVAQERLRISGNIGQQASTTTVSQEQSFDRYFEQGSYTFEREIPQSVIFDFAAMVRTELALIDADTTHRAFRNELRWNAAAYKLGL